MNKGASLCFAKRMERLVGFSHYSYYVIFAIIFAFFVSFCGSLYRYKLIKEVGDGTFGSVWRAINKQSGEVVSVFLLFFLLSV